MVTPIKSEIVKLATEKWHADQLRKGNPAFDIKPEIDELRESGYLSLAQCELMRNQDYEEWDGYNEKVESVQKALEFEEKSEFKTIEIIDLNEVLKSGLAIVGGRGTAKTTTAKHLIRRLIREKASVKIRAFEDAYEFSKNSDLPVYQILTAQTRRIYDLPHCSYFTGKLYNPEDATTILRSFVIRDWGKQVEKVLASNGQYDKWILYVTDDSHSILDRYSLTRTINKTLLRWVGTGRNYCMSYVTVSQRFQSIPTQLLERINTGYLIFKLTGANNKSKLKAIGLDKPIIKQIEKLKTGEAIFYYDGKTELIYVPKFESVNNPRRIF
jgi:Cdc6-like AAA superfamily ATPase